MIDVNFYASCVMDVVSWRYFRSSFVCLISSVMDVVRIFMLRVQKFFLLHVSCFFQAGGVVVFLEFLCLCATIFMQYEELAMQASMVSYAFLYLSTCP
jgi:hypothetical protein